MRLTGNVSIPKRPSSIGGLLSWARSVNTALRDLRDRKIVSNQPRRGSGGIVRFRVLPVSGSAKVTVRRNGGFIYGPDGANYIPKIGGSPIDTDPAPELSVVTGVVYFELDNTVTPAVVNIKNAASMPSDTFDGTNFIVEKAHLLICEVTVSGSVVTVTQPQTVTTSLYYLVADSVRWSRI